MQAINWEAAHAAFRHSQLSITDFYQLEMEKFVPEGGRLPSKAAVVTRFRELALAEPQSKSCSKLVKVIGQMTPKHSEPPIPTPQERIIEKPFHIELPGGVKLSFTTQSPEAFAAQLLQMAGALPS